MATVKELKEWLNRFPDETIVKFGFQERSGNYESYGPMVFRTPTLQDCNDDDLWEFGSFGGQSFLMLGGNE